jgi:hypothetical protein
MSALFTDTNLYVIWKALGVDFIEHPVIPQGLQYSEHTGGHFNDIRYMYDAVYSKHQDDKHDLFGLMVDAVKDDTASDEGFLWLANTRKATFNYLINQSRTINCKSNSNTYFRKSHNPNLTRSCMFFHHAYYCSLPDNFTPIPLRLSNPSPVVFCVLILWHIFELKLKY